MRTIADQTPLSTVLANPEAVEVIRELAPEALRSPLIEALPTAPTGPLLILVLGEADQRRSAIMSRLAAFQDDTPLPPWEPPWPVPRTGIPLSTSNSPPSSPTTTPRSRWAGSTTATAGS